MTKICKKCKVEKPLGGFYADSRRRDGRRGTCKTCVKSHNANIGEKPSLGDKLKVCTKCKVTKSGECFSRLKTGANGLNPRCKDCINRATRHRHHTLPGLKEKHYIAHRIWAKENPEKMKQYVRDSKRRMAYGLEPAQYETLVQKQQNRCAICDRTMKPSHIDHCHKTGKIRGLLCSSCNTALGLLQDSTDILERARDYVKTGGVLE